MNKTAPRGYWFTDEADYKIALRCSVCGCKHQEAPEKYCPNCGADMNGAEKPDNFATRGEWVINSDGYYPYCSNCHEEPKSGRKSKFCPNCGADMNGASNVINKFLRKGGDAKNDAKKV